MRKVKNHFYYNEKIFYCFKLFTEPEPSQNSLSSLLCFLRVHFACVKTTFALILAHIQAKLMNIVIGIGRKASNRRRQSRI